jgi:hypothetical protein
MTRGRRARSHHDLRQFDDLVHALDAKEAMRWVRQSKTEKEKQTLIELARTWTQAAAESERSAAVNYRAM